MNRLLAIAGLAFVFTATTAHAEGNYFSGNLGVSMATDTTLSVSGVEFAEISFDPGLNIGGAFGYDYGKGRIEFEIAYRGWDMDTFTIPGVVAGVVIPGCPCSGTQPGDASALSFMVNGYYDFHSADSPLAPYLGAGIGFASINADLGLGADESATVFAYQLMAGIGYDINPTTVLTVGYRYFGTTDPEFVSLGIPINATIAANEFNVGVRFGF